MTPTRFQAMAVRDLRLQLREQLHLIIAGQQSGIHQQDPTILAAIRPKRPTGHGSPDTWHRVRWAYSGLASLLASLADSVVDGCLPKPVKRSVSPGRISRIAKALLFGAGPSTIARNVR